MKTNLLITVDCGKTTCRKCEWETTPAKYCVIFGERGKVIRTDGVRCAECLRAEKEARHDTTTE